MFKLPSFYYLIIALSIVTMQGCAGNSRRGAYHTTTPRSLTTCFYHFGEIYQDRIYPALSQTPGVTAIERCWSYCNNQQQPCLCYTLTYNGSIDELIAQLKQRLPVNKTLPFHCVTKGGNRLEVIFDAGFK
ncbi:MAG: hypothetical protein J7M09_04265 [Deltaproteobacteria bacterium]|nr:hypothetical protein [Candidatus Tharpella sp.]